MLHSSVFELLHYRAPDGSHPFREWFGKLRDAQAKASIGTRLYRMEHGNLGDNRPVGEGVIELRIPIGAGYRIYCARHGDQFVILLCGGDKSSQSADIERAKRYWRAWKRDRE